MKRLIKIAGLMAVIALGVIASSQVNTASAVEPALHVYVCRFEPGLWDDRNCSTKVNVLLLYHETSMGSGGEKVKSKNANTFELETKTALIKCTTAAGSGTALNPEPFKSTNGEGKGTITFEGCVVSKPTACTIPGKKVVAKELRAVVEKSEKLGPGAKFTPASGEVLAEISLSAECALGEKVLLKGSAFGIAKNAESALEFTNETGALTLGGSEAKLRGKVTLEEEAKGNALLALP